jgi:Glycosyltransferase family 87
VSRVVRAACARIQAGVILPLAVVVAMLWLIVAFLGWTWLGPTWIAAIRPAPNRINDYYQDWGSARNYLIGLPVYTHHATSIPRHLGLPTSLMQTIEYNAHPPVAVLLALPLARLDYPDAVLVWNLISLAALLASLLIVAKGLGLSWTTLPPTLGLLAFCHPVYGNLYLGQLTLELVLLVTMIWALERSGRSSAAGLIVGAAAAIKLFPAYLVLLYLARRQLRPLAAAVLSFLALNLLAVFVLGLNSYHDYITTVIPGQAKFWSCGYNLSIAGFWHKLFNPIAETGLVDPLWLSPTLARGGTLLSSLVLTLSVATCVYRAQTPLQHDLAFGTTVTAMILVSPVAWDFSLPLLLVPLALIAHSATISGSRWIPVVLCLILAITWIPQNTLTELVRTDHSLGILPWTFMLGAPSLKFYGLLATFALAVVTFRAAKRGELVP